MAIQISKKEQSRTKTNQIPKSVHQVPVKKKVRLLIIGKGTEKGDYWAFFHARKNVENTYKSIDKGKYNIILAEVSTAKELVAKINSQEIDTVRSLDVFSHGGQSALYMTVGDPRYRPDGRLLDPVNERIDWLNRWGLKNAALYQNPSKLRSQLALIADSMTLHDIELDKFTKNVKIEFHGCETAKPKPFESGWFSDSAPDPADNIAGEFSKLLFEAGHNQSFVIGSLEKSNSSINGKNTTNEQQDYRHGKRCIFRDGKNIGTTTQKGHINENI